MRSRLAAIRKSLLAWYAAAGRPDLPWRRVRNPYYTLVSEFMLQQTQVDRVAGRFVRFVTRFPDFDALARASIADVLREWKGLGYNLRAVRLRMAAEAVVEQYAGTMPSGTAELRALVGIGAYTAAAIRAFAFDLDDAPVDTNVRRIVRRLFFGVEYVAAANAREVDARARAIVPAGRAHDWSSALMDLGAAVCTARAPKCPVCPLERECAAAPIDAAYLDRVRKSSKPAASSKAVAFEKTTRYARGRIVDRLRELPPGKRISLLDLHRGLGGALGDRSVDDVRRVVASLERDGLLTRDGDRVALPE